MPKSQKAAHGFARLTATAKTRGGAGSIRRALVRAIGRGAAAVCLLAAALTARAQEEDARAIFIMNRDGSRVRQLVSLDGLKWLGAPAWSHDGKRIAFHAR